MSSGMETYDEEFEAIVRQILVRVGEDPERQGLKRTPLRVAKAMDFLPSSLKPQRVKWPVLKVPPFM